MLAGPFSLCLQPLSFMPTGPFIYAYGPSLVIVFLYAILTVSPMICYPLLSLNIARHLDSYPNSFLLDNDDDDDDDDDDDNDD